MRIRAPGLGSWKSFSTRSLSARIVSSSCTTLSGGRPPSLADRFIEPRDTVIRMPRPERLLDLDVDRVLEPGRIEIVMVRRRRAAGDQELGQRHPHREAEVIGLQPRPDRIERGEPGKERLVDRLRVGAGERLVEMVMGVDQPRQHDVARGVENRIDAFGRPARSDALGDARPLDDHAAFGAVGENRQGVLDPSPHEAPRDQTRSSLRATGGICQQWTGRRPGSRSRLRRSATWPSPKASGCAAADVSHQVRRASTAVRATTQSGERPSCAKAGRMPASSRTGSV